MKNVYIYTTPTCGYCKMAKKFFSENNIKYTEYNVAEDEKKAHEAVHKSGQMGVPVIVLEENGKEEVMVGYSQEALIKSLNINT